MSTTTQKAEKSIRGVVTRKSGNQTVRVETKITKVHPIYRKRYTLTRHYLAHDPNNSMVIGQEVTIVPSRSVSKTKHWVVTYA